MPPMRHLNSLCNMTPSEVITMYTSDPDWLEPNVVVGGRMATPGIIQKLGFDKQPTMPTSAEGMTIGQRKKRGVQEVAVPVAIRFRECQEVVSGVGRCHRTVGHRQSMDLEQLANAKPLVAADKAVANVLARRHEREMAQVREAQRKLNPNKRQREYI